MARIIESAEGGRRIIRLSSNDIISIVREYQRIVSKSVNIADTKNLLEDYLICIPEDL